jgi:hypothetical protein
MFDRITRAVAYLLTVTAHVSRESSLRMLAVLRDHPDEATRRLSRWALTNRFRIVTENGELPGSTVNGAVHGEIRVLRLFEM